MFRNLNNQLSDAKRSGPGGQQEATILHLGGKGGGLVSAEAFKDKACYVCLLRRNWNSVLQSNCCLSCCLSSHYFSCLPAFL